MNMHLKCSTKQDQHLGAIIMNMSRNEHIWYVCIQNANAQYL